MKTLSEAFLHSLESLLILNLLVAPIAAQADQPMYALSFEMQGVDGGQPSILADVAIKDGLCPDRQDRW